jgi:hypothetical protein
LVVFGEAAAGPTAAARAVQAAAAATINWEDVAETARARGEEKILRWLQGLQPKKAKGRR